MPKLIGVDEAGRSPVLGDLIVVGVMVHSPWQVRKLKDLGVADSKKFTPKQRFELAIKIAEITDIDRSISITPHLIDHYVSEHRLGHLLVDKVAEIVRLEKPSNLWMHRIQASGVPNGGIAKIIGNNFGMNLHIVKNEDDHPLVASASIVATHLRTQHMLKLHQTYGLDIGSGEPADRKTRIFLESCNGKYPEFVRKSWVTVKNLKIRRQSSRTTKKLKSETIINSPVSTQG